MYAHFYHLSESPFNLTPDPKFHYINESTREAMASIVHGVGARKGFLTLIGEAGTGKTTLLKRIVEEIEGETIVVFVFNPGVSFDELLEFICTELGIASDGRRRLTLLDRLNTFLLEQLTAGRNVVLMIDEAQTLEDSVLEELRLLSNLETSKEKILQILLAGQPELEEKLRKPGLRQLRQRVAVRATLKPMRSDEIGAYVETRLRSAGADRNDLFTPSALRKIWSASQGIPRVINVICDNAMMIAFAEGKQRISAAVTREAIRDLQGSGATSGGPLYRLREWLGQPAVRYSAAAVVPLALVVTFALSMVRGSSAISAREMATAPSPAPVNSVSVKPEPVEAARERAQRREVLPSPRQPASAAAPQLPPGGPVSSRPTPVVATRVEPAEIPQPDLTTNGDVDASDTVVADTVRRAEVVARSTAARLYHRQRTSLEESAKRVMEGGRDTPGPIDSPRLAAEPAVPEVEADTAPPAATRPPAVDGGHKNESLAGATDSLEVPLDSLADMTEPIASAKPTELETQRKGRMLGPADDEPIVGQLVRVLPGDTVWDIAVAHYGAAGPVTLKRILNSNPRIVDPRNLEVGAHIYLPFQRPDQMVRSGPGGTYTVLVAVSPQEPILESVRDWLATIVTGADVAMSKGSGAQSIFQVQIVGLKSRDEALRVASQVLAAYGRSRHS